MADEQIDPGGDTEMFRAFVAGSENYQERTSSSGPIVVAGVALLVAVVAFIVILALG
jgi:hypothetical protein